MPAEMGTGRLEAFSDGVIAVIVTIMVLELHAPSQPTIGALIQLAPVFLSYALSFLVVAIMWVNHHHMMHAARGVTPQLLWSNLNLLFWMSLVPFVTDYLGKNHREPLAVGLYGLNLGMCGLAFAILRKEMERQESANQELVDYHRGMFRKNMFSAALYFSSLPLAYVSVYWAYAIFVFIPAAYFVPEKKLETVGE